MLAGIGVGEDDVVRRVLAGVRHRDGVLDHVARLHRSPPFRSVADLGGHDLRGVQVDGRGHHAGEIADRWRSVKVKVALVAPLGRSPVGSDDLGVEAELVDDNSGFLAVTATPRFEIVLLKKLLAGFSGVAERRAVQATCCRR